MMVCPYCRDSVQETEAVICPVCEATHHEECWSANEEACSVFGCASRIDSEYAGCPRCEEVYPYGTRLCRSCNLPVLSPREYLRYIESYDWMKLPLEARQSAFLCAGFLQNHSIPTRINKKLAVSMFHLYGGESLSVPAEDYEYATRLLKELSQQFRQCTECGHVVSNEEQDCSYCVEGTEG